MLLHQGLGGGKKEDPSLVQPGETNHERDDRFAQTRGNHYQAGGLKGGGSQVHLEEPLFYCMRLQEWMLQIGGHNRSFNGHCIRYCCIGYYYIRYDY